MGLVSDLAGSLKGVVEILKNNQGSLESSLKDIARTATALGIFPKPIRPRVLPLSL